MVYFCPYLFNDKKARFLKQHSISFGIDFNIQTTFNQVIYNCPVFPSLCITHACTHTTSVTNPNAPAQF